MRVPTSHTAVLQPSYRYKYGNAGDTELYPDLIDQEQSMNRQLALQSRYKQLDAENERDEILRRNRLGISPLSVMINDPHSAVYRDIDPATGREPEPFIDVSIGDMQGGTPAPLPMVRPMGISPLRQIRPEFKDALENQSLNNNRTRTVEEMAKIANAEAEAKMRLEGKKTELKTGLYQQQAQDKALGTAANIQAKAPGADMTTIANDYLTSQSATALTMSAAPSGNVVEEEDESGKVIRRADGRRYFVPVNGQPVEITQ